MSSKAKLCWISGRVQGVFFRVSTQRKAVKLGVSGYAKNLPDGRVEVLAFGDHEPMEALIEWLHRGPPGARVEKLEIQEHSVPDWQGFEIRR